MAIERPDSCEVSITDKKRLGSMERHRLFVDLPRRFSGKIILAFKDGMVDEKNCEEINWLRVKM